MIDKIFVGQPKKLGMLGSKRSLDRPFLSSIAKEEVDGEIWLGKYVCGWRVRAFLPQVWALIAVTQQWI